MALPRWFSLTTLVLVVLGGAIGVAVRALVVVPLSVGTHPLLVPAVTAAVNVLGSLLLGVVVGALDDRMPRLRAFLGTGVLGGFTTYSAFAVHAVTTAAASPVIGVLLMAVSVFAGLFAAAAGLMLGRRIAGAPGEAEPPEEAE